MSRMGFLMVLLASLLTVRRRAFLCGCRDVWTGRAAVDVPMDAERWNLLDAEITSRDGRACMAGIATVKDVVFQDGVIEVDMLLARERTYAGIDFRIQSAAECEQIYIRRIGSVLSDAIQYTPVFNGVRGVAALQRGWVHGGNRPSL